MANVVYMGIARVPDKQILVSCVATDSREQSKQQLDSILSRVLVSGRIDEHDRLTIADKDVGNIHYSADPALVYLGTSPPTQKKAFRKPSSNALPNDVCSFMLRDAVITATNYPQRTAFKLLSEARAEFEQEFKTELAGGKNDGVAKVAKPFLKRMMDRYEDVAREDKISSVALQVDQVKGLMQTNIQAALKVCMISLQERVGTDNRVYLTFDLLMDRTKKTWKHSSTAATQCGTKRVLLIGARKTPRSGCGGRA